MAIRFYRTAEVPYGCFSNFSRHPIELDGVLWPTSEHYFQAQKFAGTPAVEQVRQAKTAMIAAQMGRDRSLPLRPDWDAVKDDVMRRAVYQKFAIHEDIRAILLGTGDEEIIEGSPADSYWGCGADGNGQNKLGVILKEVRAALRERSSTKPSKPSHE